MLFGDMLTGCVVAVSITDWLTPRENTRLGDVIIMTEDAGGGTVCAAALYYYGHDVAD